MEKVFYYSDELTDDFAGVSRRHIEVDENFKFIHKNIFWKFCAFIVYRIIMTPFAWLFCKIKFNIKIVNKKALSSYKKTGYFLFGNHTQLPADAFIGNLITFPKPAYFVVHPDNIALWGTKNIMQMLGAIPLPTTLKGMRSFLYTIEKRSVEKSAVVIFPEAHIWPYYTDIRKFPSSSFKYPVKFSDPVFCFTTTYRKRQVFKTPQITIFIDGPFLSDNSLSLKENQEKIHLDVYNTMKKRAEYSNYQYVKYIKTEERSQQNGE